MAFLSRSRRHWLSYSLRTIFVVVTILCVWLGFQAKLARDKRDREVIVMAANHAIRDHMRIDPNQRKGDEIAEELWGEAIARLKPIRVRHEGVNVAIVLREEGGTEEGFYVVTLISSSKPIVGDRLSVLEQLSQSGDMTSGTLYRYRLRQTAKSR